MRLYLYNIALLLVLGAFYFRAYGQAPGSLQIDSLKKILLTQKEDTNKGNTLNALSWDFYNEGDFDNSSQYSDKALALAEKLNYKKGQSVAYKTKAWLAGNSEESLHFLNLSISFAKETKDSSEIYWSYFGKGDLCRSRENYAEALSSYLQALEIAELTGYKYGMASAYQEIAAIYVTLGNDAEVVKNFRYALKLFDELKSFEDIASCYLGIGQNYYNKGDYNAALNNLNLGLIKIEQAGLKVHPGFDIKGWILLNIGRCHEMLATPAIAGININAAEVEKKYIEAEYNYNAAKVFAEKDRNFFLWPEVFLSIGNLYLKTNRIVASKPYLDSAFQVFQFLNSKDGLQKIYLKYSLYDSAIGNYKRAYEDHKLYMQYFKEIQSDSSIQKTTQLQAQYNFDKKEAIVKAAQDKKDAEEKLKKYQQFFILLGVIAIALIQYRSSKKKQKANLLLRLEKEKVEATLNELRSTQAQLIQSEKMASLGELTAGIAHEIQNPLNFVNNFSEVNKELLVEMKDEMSKGNLDDANDIANDVIANSEKISHHGKRADSIVKGMLQHSRSSNGVKELTDINALADEYLRLAYHGLRAKDKNFNTEMKTDFDETIGNINIIPQDIGRVLLNLYNNAFYAVAERKKQQPAGQAGYEPIVSISTNRSISPGEVRISVKDNGNGIPQKIVDKIFQPFFTTKPTGQGTGLGLSLSYDIIKAHGGDIKVKSKEGEGSEFTIQLPITIV